MDRGANFAIELYDAPNASWVDVNAWAEAGTLEIDLELNSRGTLHIELVETSEAGPVPITPKASMRIRVRNNTAVYFGGTIDSADQIYDDFDTGYIKWALEAVDYSRLLARFPVNNVWTSMHAGDIVKAIISKIPSSEGIDTTNVQKGPKIAKATFPNLTAHEAIDEIARLAMYKWYMDAEKKMYFFEPKAGAQAASWNINTAAVNAGRFYLKAPRVTRETAQYRNLQEVIGGTTTDDNWSYYPTLDKPGIAGTYEPGKTSSKDIVRSWSIGKPISVISRIVFCPTQYYDEATAEAPYRISEQQNGGAFYYKRGEATLRLSDEWQNYAGVTETVDQFAPRKGQWFWIKYKSQTSVSARIEKTEEWCNSEGLAAEDTIYDMAQMEGGSGIYKNIEINDNLKTVRECYERARALLIQYGKIPTLVNYESLNWGDMQPGKFQELWLYGYSGKPCTCVKMGIKDVDGCELVAFFELVGSEAFSGLAYFRSISGGQTPRMQSTYTIRADEVVTDYIGHQETLAVTDTLTKTGPSTSKAWGIAKMNEGGVWG